MAFSQYLASLTLANFPQNVPSLLYGNGTLLVGKRLESLAFSHKQSARLQKNMTNNEKGFSLIELLIVVVVIGIIAAIAIPNLLAARRSANEGSAVATMRKVSNAQLMFYSTLGNANFGSGAQLFSSQMIGARTAAALNVNVGGSPATNSARDGYRFRIQTTAANPVTGQQATYVFSAIPSSASGVTQTGSRRFCVNESGLMRAVTTSISSHFNYSQCNTTAVFAP